MAADIKVARVTGQVAETIHNHTHHHHQTTIHAHGPVYVAPDQWAGQAGFALQPPPAPPARTPKPKRGGYDLSPAMLELLALMRPLPKPVRIDVLGWMRCEFGTSMVAELEPRELYRARAHVLDARRTRALVAEQLLNQ